MDKILLLFALLYLCTISTNCAAQPKDETIEAKIQGILYSPANSYEGTPYLFKNWLPSSIELTNGRTIEELKIKYNLLTSDLLFYHSKIGKLFTIDKNTLLAFKINLDSLNSLNFLRYCGSNVGYKLRNSDFIQILHRGDINFFIKHTASIAASNDINSKDEVVPKKLYFIQTNGKTHEIKLRIRSIVKIFPEKKQVIKKIVSENKLRNRSEKALTTLVELLDELPEP